MFEKSDKTIRLLSFTEDQPREAQGSLIPRRTAIAEEAKKRAKAVSHALGFKRFVQVTVAAAAVFLLAIVSITGYGLYSSNSLPASPVITIVDPYTLVGTELEYGPHLALTKTNFFIETRDSFVEEGLTFVEIDLSRQQLRYFENGVLLQSAEVVSLGEEGSWWDTPAGLYKVNSKDERLFSTFGQVYLPWNITFGGNFVIHGWPEYPDGTLVGRSYAGGGVRLENGAAEQLFKVIKKRTPVLVHTAPQVKDSFIYEPQVSDVTASQYLIADVENGTILAANNIDQSAPIASVTKLMTAVIAAEQINLDTRVRVTSPTFITSLVPRLAERSSVSMYSLLQLLLVESSNEAAEVIAAELGREEFIAEMNEKARRLGLFNTTFSDPSGLSSENVSSVNDLYRLTNYIYENRRFIFEITAKIDVPTTFVGGEFDGLINFNQIENLENFIGGKVGETEAAGQTSVSLHKIKIQGKDRIVMVILLGSEDRSKDVQTLINYVETNFTR